MEFKFDKRKIMKEKEEGLKLNLDFTKVKKIAVIEEDFIPVAVQNIETGKEVLFASGQLAKKCWAHQEYCRHLPGGPNIKK